MIPASQPATTNAPMRGATAAAVIAYRVILFWLPLLVGVFTFWSLRRGLNRPDRTDLCYTPAAA